MVRRVGLRWLLGLIILLACAGVSRAAVQATANCTNKELTVLNDGSSTISALIEIGAQGTCNGQPLNLFMESSEQIPPSADDYVIGNNVCEVTKGEGCVNSPDDCNFKDSGNPSQRYCCGGGYSGIPAVSCNDSRCTGNGNTCSTDDGLTHLTFADLGISLSCSGQNDAFVAFAALTNLATGGTLDDSAYCTVGSLSTVSRSSVSADIAANLAVINDIDFGAIDGGTCLGFSESLLGVQDKSAGNSYMGIFSARYICPDGDPTSSTPCPGTDPPGSGIDAPGINRNHIGFDTTSSCDLFSIRYPSGEGLPVCCDYEDFAIQCARTVVTQRNTGSGFLWVVPPYWSPLDQSVDKESGVSSHIDCLDFYFNRDTPNQGTATTGDCSDDDPDFDDIASFNCDNCDEAYNPDQANMDGDSLGDACDPDIDADGIANGSDNCSTTYNPSQADRDVDGSGDACDSVTDFYTASNDYGTTPGQQASNDYTATFLPYSLDSLREGFSETLVGTTSRLSHTWEFEDIPAGTYTVEIRGYRYDNSDGDDFRFYAGLTSGPFFQVITGAIIDQDTVDKVINADLPFEVTTTGSVFINVKDTNTTSGSGLDVLWVDEIRLIPVLQ